MDGAVDLAGQQGRLDLLGEEALAADVHQTAVLDLVTAGGDPDQARRRVVAQGGADRRAHQAGLGQGQFRRPRADANLLPDHPPTATPRGDP